MAQQVSSTATKPEDLSVIPWPHRVEGKNQSLQVK